MNQHQKSGPCSSTFCIDNYYCCACSKTSISINKYMQKVGEPENDARFPSSQYFVPLTHDILPPIAHNILRYFVPLAHDILPLIAHDILSPLAHNILSPLAHIILRYFVPPSSRYFVPPSSRDFTIFCPPQLTNSLLCRILGFKDDRPTAPGPAITSLQDIHITDGTSCRVSGHVRSHNGVCHVISYDVMVCHVIS